MFIENTPQRIPPNRLLSLYMVIFLLIFPIMIMSTGLWNLAVIGCMIFSNINKSVSLFLSNITDYNLAKDI